MGDVTGWKELLQSVGFRFEPAANGIPSSVFFPQNDPEDRLTQCSASLQALLGIFSLLISHLHLNTYCRVLMEIVYNIIISILNNYIHSIFKKFWG